MQIVAHLRGQIETINYKRRKSKYQEKINSDHDEEPHKPVLRQKALKSLCPETKIFFWLILTSCIFFYLKYMAQM